ncbi:MAG: AAA family ATPase [Saprospiraceae bacterium]|nr:AAA family ATPase [Saprospiraceae bacterium]
MIKNLEVKNFRSIKSANIDLGRFTVLTGANNSGKSSLLYALQVLKNVVSNPNRSIDELLNLGFLNLGGLEEVSFLKDNDDPVEIFTLGEREMSQAYYGVSFGRKISYLMTKGVDPFIFKAMLVVSFPYPLNKTMGTKLTHLREDGDNNLIINFNWDGLNLVESNEQNKIYDFIVSTGPNALQRLDITPTHRGFTKPIYNTIPLDNTIFTEDEVATLLAKDKKLQTKVSYFFEKITGKRLTVSMSEGAGFFYIQVREPDLPFSTEIVNQGMGINQILFLLIKILYSQNTTICIDEPEIHLHPSMMEQFVKVLVEIAEKENKQFLFSTHSEHWLMSLLAEVAEGHLKSDDLKVYYLTKEGQETKIEEQDVNEQGQLKGGLKNFIDAEMRLTDRFFNAETT